MKNFLARDGNSNKNFHFFKGCAISFGYTASAHLDSVLLKLETFSKNETKKSGGLFSSIMKDGSSKSGNPDHIKSTIVLAYGYVTYFAPKDLIISRLEANILRSVSGYAALNTKVRVILIIHLLSIHSNLTLFYLYRNWS
jgi:hypothetical protein